MGWKGYDEILWRREDEGEGNIGKDIVWKTEKMMGREKLTGCIDRGGEA